jgi:hypothetical protein
LGAVAPHHHFSIFKHLKFIGSKERHQSELVEVTVCLDS